MVNNKLLVIWLITIAAIVFIGYYDRRAAIFLALLLAGLYAVRFVMGNSKK